MTVSSSTPKRGNAGKRTSGTANSNQDNKTQADQVKVDIVNNEPTTDMSPENQLEIVDKPAKKGSQANTAPTQIQVASTMTFMNRPIEHSHLEIAGMLSANRPIFKSNTPNDVALIHLEDAVGALANRPIEASHLQITSMVMNRPIATNDIDDPVTLMGFLD
ncbi:hypothetical protein PCC9214_01773 [Planktothrix tepida]|uniref:Uncharacterized protein n=2 Tax=Planktothrix TaxID=54304 RepID=A0A1J1LL72_9CYAN|nr:MULTISPECIES: hypothetical protein [Planktothrix]CAD5938663.1 hypothetical protein PCC9214_01773 [Planktothrix tepida]CAD5973108.1 hypothetical protein NO713_03965 [Planktothrix pseudagardhii]CUR33264.1 conserved hypothetical protein [Planktothrix tepida PCC 9214]